MTLPIEQQAWDAFTRTPPRYHQPDTTSTSPATEAPVTLTIIEEKLQGFVTDIVTHVQAAAADVKPHLDELEDLGRTVADDPLFQLALEDTVPDEYRQGAADLLRAAVAGWKSVQAALEAERGTPPETLADVPAVPDMPADGENLHAGEPAPAGA